MSVPQKNDVGIKINKIPTQCKLFTSNFFKMVNY